MSTRSNASTSNFVFDTSKIPSAVNGDRGKSKPLSYEDWAPEELAAVNVESRILKFDHGLYALSVAEVDGVTSEHLGILLPAVHISHPPWNHLRGTEIIAADRDSAFWLGNEGGTAVIKIPPDGGFLVITTYEQRGQPSRRPEIAIRRIDQPARVLTRASGAAPPMQRTRNIMMEVLLHIERTGDRHMTAEDWIGNRGKKLRLEAFSIRPSETLEPTDIEYKAYGPNGRETPWVSDGKICGTRGLSLPLTGFAIRVATHLRDRFQIEYQGAFFESGTCGPNRDGEPCIPRIADDPLEAINLRLFERIAGLATAERGL